MTISKEQAEEIIKLMETAQESDFVTIGNGTTNYISSVEDFDEVYDYEDEYDSLLDFLMASDIDDLDMVGLHIIDEVNDYEYTEDEFVSIPTLLKHGCYFFRKVETGRFGAVVNG